MFNIDNAIEQVIYAAAGDEWTDVKEAKTTIITEYNKLHEALKHIRIVAGGSDDDSAIYTVADCYDIATKALE